MCTFRCTLMQGRWFLPTFYFGPPVCIYRSIVSSPRSMPDVCPPWFPQQSWNRELDHFNSWLGNTMEIWSKSLKIGNWAWIFYFSEINNLGHTCAMLTNHVNLHCRHNKQLISPWKISLPARRLHAGAHSIWLTQQATGMFPMQEYW